MSDVRIFLDYFNFGTHFRTIKNCPPKLWSCAFKIDLNILFSDSHTLIFVCPIFYAYGVKLILRTIWRVFIDEENKKRDYKWTPSTLFVYRSYYKKYHITVYILEKSIRNNYVMITLSKQTYYVTITLYFSLDNFLYGM